MAKSSKRESFIFYRSFYDAIKDVSPEDQAVAFRAICEYALDGKKIKINGAASAIFKLVKPQIDANNQRYENGLKGAKYGRKGGRPKDNPKETPNKPQDNPKETPNENVNVNVNDNENVNDNTPQTPQGAALDSADGSETMFGGKITVDEFEKLSLEEQEAMYKAEGWE